ncbi:hypothetical protein AJ79_04527 [Helicocarpus griseus UAMH5409]|uniref:Secreted protein n=1 Tax=Helicocarpus griseus UAMH5409 TaxID=1447875 RepID=A0A2B7XTU3_9EURO|nr:hypothetical protein AJ79_04527 [Helicocarpus griseus UAMH5409]
MIPALAFILVIISAALAASPQSPSPNEALTPSSKRAMANPAGDLFVAIELAPTKPASTDPVQLTVKVHNQNKEQAVTVLKWNSPLDPQANVLGVFRMWEPFHNNFVEFLTIKISRKLPPSQDDVVEIPPNGFEEVQVTLKPLDELNPDSDYQIEARGEWMALWSGDDVTAAQLEDLSTASKGDYESNEITLRFK